MANPFNVVAIITMSSSSYATMKSTLSSQHGPFLSPFLCFLFFKARTPQQSQKKIKNIKHTFTSGSKLQIANKASPFMRIQTKNNNKLDASSQAEFAST
jgi:hypothetical protein